VQFEDFCRIDLQLSRRTSELYRRHIKRLAKYLKGQHLKEVITDGIRKYLKAFDGLSPYTYSNALKALRAFFRDFMKAGYLVESFRFPSIAYNPIIVPSKGELRIFYENLKTVQECTSFLLYATSGLRRNEVLSLLVNDIDFDKRMIIPRTGRNERTNRTKRMWVSFFNEEAEKHLVLHLKDNDSSRIFSIAPSTLAWKWSKMSKRINIHISPTVLRAWFATEMGELGVQDRYIDAFCGRVPKSILARHYTDYSPERLKRIYDKAELRVLS
jgi:integrase